jgi:hypothetical protein
MARVRAGADGTMNRPMPAEPNVSVPDDADTTTENVPEPSDAGSISGDQG